MVPENHGKPSTWGLICGAHFHLLQHPSSPHDHFPSSSFFVSTTCCSLCHDAAAADTVIARCLYPNTLVVHVYVGIVEVKYHQYPVILHVRCK